MIESVHSKNKWSSIIMNSWISVVWSAINGWPRILAVMGSLVSAAALSLVPSSLARKQASGKRQRLLRLYLLSDKLVIGVCLAHRPRKPLLKPSWWKGKFATGLDAGNWDGGRWNDVAKTTPCHNHPTPDNQEASAFYGLGTDYMQK